MTIGDTEGYTVEGRRLYLLENITMRSTGKLPLATGDAGSASEEGRFLEESDHAGGSLAVVVNEFLAKRHWPGKGAVGNGFASEARKSLGGPSWGWFAIFGSAGFCTR